MIYTITFNPAVDLVMNLDNFHQNQLNRVDHQDFIVGGKGINISIVLKELGINSTALGFAGGFTGQFIQEELTRQQINHHFIQVNQASRVNIKLNHQKSETEINGSGPYVSPEDFLEMVDLLTNNLVAEDVVFLSGNVAKGLDAKAYRQIANICQLKQVKFIVDSNKDLLMECLPYHPYLIKPNQKELEEIFEVNIHSKEALKTYAVRLQSEGARNVIISCGADGALLLTETKEYYVSDVPQGQVIHSTGAGDSMVAGFVAGMLKGKGYQTSFLQGSACGSATSFSKGTGQFPLIQSLMEQINIEKQ